METKTRFTDAPWERGTMQVQGEAVFRPAVGTADGKLICCRWMTRTYEECLCEHPEQNEGIVCSHYVCDLFKRKEGEK